jgi:hypothetical protein
LGSGLILAFAFCLLTSDLARLPAAPVVLWQARYDGPVHGEDRLTGLVTDTAGNCWLSGYSFGDTTDFDFATVRVSPQGKIAWTRRYGSPLKCEDRSWCLARDSAGSIIAAGGSIADFNIGWDFLLIKYNRAGDRVWLRRYDSPFHSDDKPAALAVGPKDCLYIAGFSRHKPAPGWQPATRDPQLARTDTDVSLVKYSAKGDTLWQRFYNGRAGMDDGAAALAVDRAGNCYVVAKVVNSQPGTDITLLKYRPDGALAWFRDIDGPGHSTDMPTAVLLSNLQLVTRAHPLTTTSAALTQPATNSGSRPMMAPAGLTSHRPPASIPPGTSSSRASQPAPCLPSTSPRSSTRRRANGSGPGATIARATTPTAAPASLPTGRTGSSSAAIR